MKKALLSVLVLGFATSAMASARLVTTEEKLANIACFKFQGQDNEVRDLCAKLIVERKMKQSATNAKLQAQQMEKDLTSIYHKELSNDEAILSYGGLKNLTVECNPADLDGVYCRVSAEAGDDAGKLFVAIDVKAEKQANGSIKRTRLAKEVVNID